MNDYQGIRFKYSDVKKEVHAMKRLADSFLDNNWKWVLEKCEENLYNAQYSSGKTSWEIPRKNPLRTRVSNGEYRASSNEGGAKVFGELCFKWENYNPDKGAKKQTYFILNGIA